MPWPATTSSPRDRGPVSSIASSGQMLPWCSGPSGWRPADSGNRVAGDGRGRKPPGAMRPSLWNVGRDNSGVRARCGSGASRSGAGAGAATLRAAPKPPDEGGSRSCCPSAADHPLSRSGATRRGGEAAANGDVVGRRAARALDGRCVQLPHSAPLSPARPRSATHPGMSGPPSPARPRPPCSRAGSGGGPPSLTSGPTVRRCPRRCAALPLPGRCCARRPRSTPYPRAEPDTHVEAEPHAADHVRAGRRPEPTGLGQPRGAVVGA